MAELVNIALLSASVLFIGFLLVSDGLCTDGSFNGRYNNPWQSSPHSQSAGQSYSNPWTNHGQQPLYQTGFSTSTPWPALGATPDYNRLFSDIGESMIRAYNPGPNARQPHVGNDYYSGYFNNRHNGQSYNNYNNRNNGPSAGSDRSSTNNREQNPRVDVSDNDLREFSEQLLTKDDNNAAGLITINFQGRTTSRSKVDEAPLALITTDDQQIYRIPTISKLKRLYDNYVLESNKREDYTVQEQNEEDDFLDSILSTDVMEYTREFLIEKGIINRNPNDFKNKLKEIWFDMYPRGGGQVGSSGFEHVFVAEVKRNQVSGLHNWVFFNEEEKENKANYLGYMKKIDLDGKGAILKLHFKYNGIDKPVASMFIGTSPEFEMALYSTCFLLRSNRVCPLKLNNNRFIIRTFSYRYQNKNFIGSAFPEI